VCEAAVSGGAGHVVGVEVVGLAVGPWVHRVSADAAGVAGLEGLEQVGSCSAVGGGAVDGGGAAASGERHQRSASGVVHHWTIEGTGWCSRWAGHHVSQVCSFVEQLVDA
jgi:hypothetical protein